MSTSDWIAICALTVAAVSAAISLYALRETRRANRLALLDRRVAIYEAFKCLAAEAICQDEMLSSEQLHAFEPHAKAAVLYLPTQLAAEIAAFYEDCGTVVWARGLRQPADGEYVLKSKRAAERIHQNALGIQDRLLALVRHATAA